MPVFDIVVHDLKADNNPPANFPESERPPHEKFRISDRLWIGRLLEATAQCVFETCTPRVYGFQRPKMPFHHIYIYGKEVPLPFSLSKERWDDDLKLQALVALSRLIHPTSASLRLAARVELDSEGMMKWISPAQLAGVQMDAFIAPTNSRNWLTLQEFEELREIAGVLDRPALPDRVWRAFWYHEEAARTYEVDIRWPLAVTGLEALVHTDRENSGLQFRRRCSTLARELGVDEFGENEASDAWEMRSGLTHGQNLGTLSAEHLKLYVPMESVLRLAVLKAFRDQSFCRVFETDSAIRACWPLNSSVRAD